MKKKTAVKTKTKTKTKAKGAAPQKAARPAVFTPHQLGTIKKKLLEMREDLVKTVKNQQVGEADSETGDPADQASNSIEKEIMFELSDTERVNLDQVEASLRKIDKGSYGICESCRKPISKPRLDALPFARYCITCQSTSEHAPEASGESTQDFRVVGEEQ